MVIIFVSRQLSDANAVVQVEDTRISSEAPADNKHETLIDILVAPTEGQDIRWGTRLKVQEFTFEQIFIAP